MARAGALLLALAAACAVAVPAARADGDPASDVLLFQRVFLPFYEPVPTAEGKELKRVVTAAKAGGYPIRVAVIGGKGDLGAVPSFWRKPRPYADFLGQELSLVPNTPYRDRVLVAMPNGFGLSRNGKAVPAELKTLKTVETPEAAGDDVTVGAIRAVQALAAAKGVKVKANIPSSSGSGGSNATLVIVAVAITLLVLGAALETVRRLRRRPS